MQVLDDSTPPKIEEILVESAITSALSWLLVNTRQGMFDYYLFAQLGCLWIVYCRWRNSVSKASSRWMLTLRPWRLMDTLLSR